MPELENQPLIRRQNRPWDNPALARMEVEPAGRIEKQRETIGGKQHTMMRHPAQTQLQRQAPIRRQASRVDREGQGGADLELLDGERRLGA